MLTSERTIADKVNDLMDAAAEGGFYGGYDNDHGGITRTNLAWFVYHSPLRGRWHAFGQITEYESIDRMVYHNWLEFPDLYDHLVSPTYVDDVTYEYVFDEIDDIDDWIRDGFDDIF